ncbi:unnamed protein product [Coffea canephora]|uniref:DH200=94 genomic scaffold, scaffold_175 n=1 Tax=Coffea canephora TaxID=49390 RepID=A0A068VAI6_COFCA|nr:unnamed protein product [Coffea canephora]
MSKIASGIIIDDCGIILTYAKAVDDVEGVKVILHDGRDYWAKVLHIDCVSSIAMIKIEPKPARPLPTARLGTPTSVKQGDSVFSWGSPYFVKNTLTAGIVSAVDRTNHDILHLCLRGPRLEYIQTDCPLLVGSFGGPLLDVNGEVIGINTLSVDLNNSKGLSFAVSIGEIKTIKEHFIKHRKVLRPMLGFVLTDLNATLIEHLKETRPPFPNVQGGVLVNDAPRSLPAFAAGIRPGHVVVGFDGKPVQSIKEIVTIMKNSVEHDGSFGSFELMVIGPDDNDYKTFTVTSKEWASRYAVV